MAFGTDLVEAFVTVIGSNTAKVAAGVTRLAEIVIINVLIPFTVAQARKNWALLAVTFTTFAELYIPTNLFVDKWEDGELVHETIDEFTFATEAYHSCTN